MTARYYLRFCGRPVCDELGSIAGRELMAKAEVCQCSWRAKKDAQAAMRRLNGLPGYAGSASLHEGECPRTAETERRRA